MEYSPSIDYRKKRGLVEDIHRTIDGIEEDKATRAALVRHFERPERELKPLRGLSILDVGCGGGLVSEPLARLGAGVTGIDPTVDSIAVARRHAEAQGLAITYRSTSVEALHTQVLAFIAYFNATMAKPCKWTYGRQPLSA